MRPLLLQNLAIADTISRGYTPRELGEPPGLRRSIDFSRRPCSLGYLSRL